MKRAVVSLLLALGATSAAAHALGATMESAPAACRAQVERALEALAPAYAKRRRPQPAGAPGSLEAAVRAYVPARYHRASEGRLAPVVRGGTCAPGMALVLDRFCVDRYEASLLLRRDDGTDIAWSPHEIPTDERTYVARSAAGATPQAYVSAKIAEGACRAAGKRLCEPVEWRVACAGSAGTAYPYGPARVAGRCHDKGASPMLAFHVATMKQGWGKTELNDPRNNQLEGTLAPTGSYPECTNDFGVYDMVGNLHEWTADPDGTFQGGYYLDTSLHGEGCAYRTIAHGFTYHDYSTGFRCCADVTAP